MVNPAEHNGAGRHPARSAAAVFLVAAFALAAWSNTFASPFQFDDHLYVIDYCRRHGLGAFWPPYGTRYVAYLTFAVNYRLGGLDVAGYHAVNLLIHIANGVLVYWLVTLILQTPRMRKASEGPPSFHIALIAALLFTVHPVQTEAVTYISQRFASLAALFYLLSLALYIRWRLGSGGGAGVFVYIASVAAAVLAQKTKEISFTLPFMAVFFEFALFEGRGMGRRLLALLPFLATLAIIPLTVFGHDIGLGGGGDAVGENVRGLQIRDLTTLSRHDYLATQFRVVVTYLRLLVLPAGQNLDYDYPMFKSFLAPQVLASFVFLLGFFSAAVYGLARSYRTGNAFARLACLGVIWFFATISIESSIIPIKDVIFEHRLYLPAAGAAFSFSAAAFYAVSRLRGRVSFAAAAAVLVVFIVAPLAAASYSRNSVWKDEVTLHEDTVRKSPGKERAHYNLAWAYQRKGELDKAIAHYEETLRLKPDKDKAHYNLALIYQGRGDAEKAMAHFREAVRLKPGNAAAHYNMAVLHWERGEARGAVDAYRAAIAANPAYENAHYNLAWTYQSLGDNRMAVVHYMETLRLNPRSADAHFNLGRVLEEEGMFEEAAREFRAAISIDPAFAGARQELDRLLGPGGR